MGWTRRKISIYTDEYIPCTCQECATKQQQRKPMSPCPICATRQPGEDLCPEHPQTSAFRDYMNLKMTPSGYQPSQLNDICSWITTHNTGAPQTSTHILATICDKCAKQVTVTLCDQCAENWETNAPGSRCTCNGTISWQLHNIPTGISQEQINPSHL